jgi:hypothetical protein
MSEKFQAFMSELLDTLDPFKDVIANVMVRDKDGEVKAAAKSRDGVISIEVTCKGDLPGFHDKACFGSLPFLRGALASPKMKGGKVELTFGDASTGKDTVLRSAILKGKNRYSVFYQAIDPFVNKMNRIKLPPMLDWPVAFAIDQEFIKTFDEMYKVNALAPKTGSGRDDIFQLAHTEEGMEVIFGDQHHRSNVVISQTVEAKPQPDGLKTNAYFSISRFKAILRLIDKGEAIGYLSNTGLRVDTETKHATYKFVTAAKLVKATKKT